MGCRKSVVLLLTYSLFVTSAFAEKSGGPAHGKCSDSALSELGTRFGIAGGVPVAATCKAWPGQGSTIIAAAYDTGAEYEKRLLVGLFDPATDKVLAAYSEKIDEDSTMMVGPDSLRIDTGRYQLAPGVRAFGVDLSSGNAQGCGDGGFGSVRTLFVRDGKAIRPVLEKLRLSQWRFISGGSSCTAEEGQTAVVETTTYTIGISKTVSNGFANLQITETSYYDTGPKPIRKPSSREVPYDGKAYRFIQF